ncbi:SCO family protein [Massilia sp. TSP1-1-2]|uniref:SCO family protein n=1 Tax=unclassified Massilia TaxID=2609279 RepID=UPI003CE76B00
MKPVFSLALILSLQAGAAQAAPALKAGVFEPPRAAPQFSLPSSNGQFKLSQLLGKVVVLEFGYTTCVDVCPVSLAALADARKKLGAAAADVQVVFITVDPARDKPARLKSYLAAFDPSFIGVTGSQAQIDALLKSYGISAARRVAGGDAKNYFMSHSSYLYFIDRKGMQRAMMPFGRPSDEMVHDLKLLLQP